MDREKTLIAGLCCAAFCLAARHVPAAPPAPPRQVGAADHPWDNGTLIDVTIALPTENASADDIEYLVKRSGEYLSVYDEVARRAPTPSERKAGRMRVVVDKCIPGEPYWFRVAAVNADAETSEFVQARPAGVPDDRGEIPPVRASRQPFDGARIWLAVVTALVCGSVLAFVFLARLGLPLKVRKIAGLDAIEEAVGRATEMGRSCLFVPGIVDMNDMQTIAGLTLLARVAERAAEYDCTLETPTARSLVMTAGRETVEAAYLSAGRPEAYNEDNVFYVTDEQFAFVSYLAGKMVREKPAACFYLGAFFAESLILAETGNAIGAIQVAGTAEPAQLPFFVAACDYTLIGEEFFAASAYLSKRPDQLGSLKGQDVGKVIAGSLILLGVGLMTLTAVFPSPTLELWATYLRDIVLQG